MAFFFSRGLVFTDLVDFITTKCPWNPQFLPAYTEEETLWKGIGDSKENLCRCVYSWKRQKAATILDVEIPRIVGQPIHDIKPLRPSLWFVKFVWNHPIAAPVRCVITSIIWRWFLCSSNKLMHNVERVLLVKKLTLYSGPSIIRTLDYSDPRLSGSRTEIIARV